MFAIFLLTLGLMIAIPILQTQVQRELEEELIFRGGQYVEAVRLYQSKNPGQFPESFEELLEEKFIRRLYPDPMTEHGEWNVILLRQRGGAAGQRAAGQRAAGRLAQARQRGASRRRGRQGGGQGDRSGAQQQQAAASPQQILIAPLNVLDSIENPSIIGVVSSSNRESVRIHNEQTSYDKWLFFYGQDPEKMPEIIYYGQEEKDE
jgi:hypothetical protein